MEDEWEMKFFTFQFGMNFSPFISFIFFFSQRGSFFQISSLHFIWLFYPCCSCTDWHGAVQWEWQKGILKCQHLPSIKCHASSFVCLFMFVCGGESVCHRTNVEKVGREGASRWKGRGPDPFFSPILHPTLYFRLSRSAHFYLRKRAGDFWEEMLFFPPVAFYFPIMLYLHCSSFQFTLSELLQTPNESVCFPVLLHVYI